MRFVATNRLLCLLNLIVGHLACMSCNVRLCPDRLNRKYTVYSGQSDSQLFCVVCMSSVVRKVFAPAGGFSLLKVFHGGFSRVRDTYPEYR